jgi:NADPH:quinone reductase-like Zn-dependent oxidoreductase
MTETMRAMEATRDDVALVEVPVPTPGPGEVRVNVASAAVNAAEGKVISGAFAGRFLHARTSPRVLGWDFAGTIDAIGDGVTDLATGDAVWGHLAFAGSQRQGTYAEYVTLPRDAVAAKPADVPFEVAAAAATCAMTSLQAMRDYGRLAAGQKVLVIGAGGGVGELAVGIAKRLGAHVTGVCSTGDVARVKAAGANVVIDRRSADPYAGESAYNVVFDTPAVASYGRCARLLRPGGTYVTTLPDGALITGLIRSQFSSRRCRFVQVASKRADLELIGGWLSDGLQVTIDSRHEINALGAALRRQTEPGRTGRVVVEVAGGW